MPYPAPRKTIMAHQSNSPSNTTFFFFLLFLFIPAQPHILQTYIVHLHPRLIPTSTSRPQFHLSLLENAINGSSGSGSPASRLLYSYHSAIHGFAATLSHEELGVMRSTPGVIAIHSDHPLQLQTTYSYKFLGLGSAGHGAWARSKFGKATIIGVLDTGVWPESPSFRDDHMPPPPRRWRGICQAGQCFNATTACNRKLIGARFYSKGYHRARSVLPASSAREYLSPRDAHGHGTHTSSTAAGNSVRGASLFGKGAGEARGMAPGAHIAMYKVCWFGLCYRSDILAGIDNAIRDGVDILSFSLGGFPLPLYMDSIAIGSFRAMERGILVVCAAGNNGPISSSVANEAPWITTVGASTLDRRFPAPVRLGNGQILYGESMYPAAATHSEKELDLELVYGWIDQAAASCSNGSVSRNKVADKMVVCDRGVGSRALKGEIVKEAGGAAMILANTEINQEENTVDLHVLPATLLGYAESLRLKHYMNSTLRPTARILFDGTVIGNSRAPTVALFSSRGPSLTNPSIIKPDVIAPGVNIIAAWPENLAPTGLPEDTRRANFSVQSGTSMACPHASGVAALVRSAHPSWSPAAIKSAIMTTADVFDHRGGPIADGAAPAGIFAMGSGHVNPNRAIEPGLVYDVKPEEYVAHLCTLGYTEKETSIITGRSVNCKELVSKVEEDWSLNYPSISVVFGSGERRKVVRRRLTNVGRANSTYWVKVSAPEGVKMVVWPERLRFSGLYERKWYRVSFMSCGKRKMKVRGSSYSEGALTWVGDTDVRSPVSVTWG